MARQRAQDWVAGDEQATGHHPATLVRDAGNVHDPNAIRVEAEGRMLGHLPRSLAAVMAQLLDAGEHWGVEIVGVRTDPHHFEQPGVEVRLTLRDEGRWTVEDVVRESVGQLTPTEVRVRLGELLYVSSGDLEVDRARLAEAIIARRHEGER